MLKPQEEGSHSQCGAAAYAARPPSAGKALCPLVSQSLTAATKLKHSRQTNLKLFPALVDEDVDHLHGG